ncbi:MAG: carboxypeptidase regulatory-like domain-containing protein [candidate division KSB1 bacterium]
MLMTSWKSWRFALCGVMLLVACGEAPRDNPLDPLSPKPETRGELRVRVQSFYPPYTPLPEVTLLLTPGNVYLRTNAEGSATFSNLAPDAYTLRTDHAGYAVDSSVIEIHARQTSEHTFRLNALPRLTNTTIYSEHISRWFPLNRDLYRLVLAAQVIDADGAQDIVRVHARSPNHGELGALAFRAETNRYEFILSTTETSLQDFLGEPFTLEARDREAATASSAPFALSRIIETTPAAETPSAFTTTAARPRFKWKNLILPYYFTFRLDISQFSPEQQFATLFESIHNIHADSSAYAAPRDLPEGTYYWTVSIVDRQGNVSRSKEATFQVQ